MKGKTTRKIFGDVPGGSRATATCFASPSPSRAKNAIKPPYLWGMLCKQAPAIMEFKHEFRITRRNVCFILPTGNVFINDLFARLPKKSASRHDWTRRRNK